MKNTIRENEVIVLHGIRLISSHPLFRTGGCYEESKQSCIPKYQSLLSCHWMCAAFVLARLGQNKDFCCQMGLAGQRTDPDSKCGKRWFRRFVHRDGDLAGDRERLVHKYNLQFTSFVLAMFWISTYNNVWR